jgi:hypothetical protein
MTSAQRCGAASAALQGALLFIDSASGDKRAMRGPNSVASGGVPAPDVACFFGRAIKFKADAQAAGCFRGACMHFPMKTQADLPQ